MIEEIAKEIYIASGGNEKAFPWPCQKADHYRNLARIAIEKSISELLARAKREKPAGYTNLYTNWLLAEARKESI